MESQNKELVVKEWMLLHVIVYQCIPLINGQMLIFCRRGPACIQGPGMSPDVQSAAPAPANAVPGHDPYGGAGC